MKLDSEVLMIPGEASRNADLENVTFNYCIFQNFFIRLWKITTNLHNHISNSF